MKKTLRTILSLAAGISLAACGANPSSPATPTSQANLADNVLQFAVGTANFAGVVGLNVATTYRQGTGSYAPGDSGTLLSTPTITLPAALPAAVLAPSGDTASYDPLSTAPYGASQSEITTDTITGSSQAINTTAVTTFGESGGVTGFGIEPYNAQGSYDAASPSSVGAPFTVPPYAIPLYDPAAYPTSAAPLGSDINVLVPWGGPPAFAYEGSATSVANTAGPPAGTDGIELGIDVFLGITPVAGGTYGLSVKVPANTGTVTKSASFTLPGVTTIATPVNPAYAGDTAGDGGGTLTGFTMPANATEAMIEVIDYGPAMGTATAQPASCNTASESTPVYYTFEESASAASITVPAALGPTATPTICTAAQNTTADGAATTADQVVVQVIAFDYPWFEASYPTTLHNPSPNILGTNKSDDIAISAAACASTDGTHCDPLPLIKRRQLIATYAKRLIR